MKRTKRMLILYITVAILGLVIITIYVVEPEYAYMPPEDEVFQVSTGSQKKINDLESQLVDIIMEENGPITRK